MTAVSDLALKPGDRGIIIGASGCGKSTLATRLVRSWQDTYCHPRLASKRRGRCMILDDKPRFRATHAVTGKSTVVRYRDFVRGDTIQGVVLDDLRNWDLVWSPELNPWQTVVVQNPKMTEPEIVALCVQATAKMFDTQKPSHPSLVYVDEGLSFFGPTGNSRFGNAIKRCFRAGREKKLSVLLSSQRPKQIDMQCLTEANRAWIFRLDYAEDMKRLQEMSLPRDTKPLEEDRIFYHFAKGGNGRKLTGPHILAL